MRKTALSMIVAVALCLPSCSFVKGLFNGDGDGPPKPQPPPVFRAETLIGFGLANGWQDADPERFADALYDNGLTFTVIEAVPWDDWTGRGDGADHECACRGECQQVSHPEKMKRFIETMRSHGITTLVSLANYNSCPAKDGTDQWFRDRLDEILTIGPNGVVLAPVTEPWENPRKTRRWTDMARAEWTGKFALPSRGGPSPQPMWSMPHDYVDIHYCRDERLLDGLRRSDQRLIHNSDCTPTGNPGPDRASKWTRAALESKSHLIVFDFRHGLVEHMSTIEAMGRTLRQWHSEQQ